VSESIRPKSGAVEPEAAPLLTGVEVAQKLMGWVPDLDPAAAEKIGAYYDELIKFNKTINLISAGTIRTAATVHFADSVLASRIISKGLIPGKPVYDFGSGNGLPGMIFGIMNPSVQVILVDRDKRKGEFLKHVYSSLKISNVSFTVSDVEALPEKSIFNGICRGFAPLHKALMLTRRPFARTGRLFHLKGDGWASELASVPSQLFSFWSPSLFGQYKIPETTVEGAIVLTEKIAD
jgi:16S rRNA (guanine527-N7)-methyltransferase